MFEHCSNKHSIHCIACKTGRISLLSQEIQATHSAVESNTSKKQFYQNDRLNQLGGTAICVLETIKSSQIKQNDALN